MPPQPSDEFPASNSGASGQPQPASVGAVPDGSALTEQLGRLLGPLGGRSAIAAMAFPASLAQPVLGAGRIRPSEVQIRAGEAFPAASLAKLPIAVELLRRVDLGALAWDERLDIRAAPRAGGGSVLDALDPGWRPTLADLCALMLTVSDNTAANIILDLIGMGEVNETMTNLGLSGTRIQRHFMDSAARTAGRDNVTTAADMLSLLTLLRGNALPQAARLRALLVRDVRTDAATFDLPPTAEIAHKSGTLDDTAHAAGLLVGPRGACAYCMLTTDQRDLSFATLVCARILRILWDAWCVVGPYSQPTN